jgi:hypothetical protein
MDLAVAERAGIGAGAALHGKQPRTVSPRLAKRNSQLIEVATVMHMSTLPSRD